MAGKKCTIGMIGLGVMGQNLLLNMAEHNFTVAGYDKDQNKVNSLRETSKEKNIYSADTLEEFINLLEKPRAIMLLVPAGQAVDAVINELLPHLQSGDLIIDAGNSHFTDSDTRAKTLQTKNIRFLSVGISGGEEGARHGPSIMPSGPKEAYEKVRAIFEAVAAKVEGKPCVTYLGPGSAGHYVKMVHNGIEYGIMQLIAEAYAFMKLLLKLNNDQLRDVFNEWNNSELSGYLIEITAHIFDKQNLIDEIVGVAKQNGTGMWTSQSAMELQIPTPTIDLAVVMRDLSVLVKQREQASALYPRSIPTFTDNQNKAIKQLHDGLFTAIIVTYAQGFSLLATASDHYVYHFELESVAQIWRGGCIIRSGLLNNISSAFHLNASLPSLLLDPALSQKIMAYQENLRHIVCDASRAGIAIPGLMTSLSYLDAYRSTWQPANLIQAQRDYFGAHTYERIDTKGIFHTEWTK
jgi:6-phosphogluconate dehydrogenase